MKKILIIIVIILFSFISYAQIKSLEIPKCDSTFTDQEYYSLLYCEKN